MKKRSGGILRQPIVTEPPAFGCWPAALGEAVAFSGALAAGEALAAALAGALGAVLAVLALGLVGGFVLVQAPKVRIIKNASKSARIGVAFFI